jgi:hypothetical protein
LDWGAGLKLIVFVACLAIAAIPVVRVSKKRMRARARLQSGKSSLTDHAVATVRGTVRALGEPMIAPLSGQACVLYATTCRVGGGAVVVGSIIRYEQKMIAFALDTREGEVIVDGVLADLALPTRPIVPRRLERELAFLEARGTEVDMRSATFEEVSVPPGMKIAVHGFVVHEQDTTAIAERGFREAPSRARIISHPDHPLTIGEP